MITYEVALDTDAAHDAALEQYMRGRHIPAILATGCFTSIHFERLDAGALRTRYVAASQADVDRYVRDHAPTMRADFLAHFPDGVALRRSLWTELERWPADPRQAPDEREMRT